MDANYNYKHNYNLNHNNNHKLHFLHDGARFSACFVENSVENAEALPAADEARRFRGSLPSVGHEVRERRNETTVSKDGTIGGHEQWPGMVKPRRCQNLLGVPKRGSAMADDTDGVTLFTATKRSTFRESTV